MPKPVLALVALLCSVLVALALRPTLDLDVARVFYTGHGHFVGDTPLGLAVRYTLWAAPFVLFAATVLTALGARAGLVADAFAPSRRGLLFLTLSLVLGPGLIVHTTLKPAMHRPRPVAVTQFGGAARFEPFYDAGGSCRDNCSFPSGEVALASWTLAPALLVPSPWRGLALAAAVLFAAATGLGRMAFGAHFPSDVAGAMLITALVVFGLHALIVRSSKAAPDDPEENARAL